MSAKSPSSSTDSSPNPKRAKSHKRPTVPYTPLPYNIGFEHVFGQLHSQGIKHMFDINTEQRLRTMIEKGNNPQNQCRESIGKVELVDPKSDKLLESGTTDSHHCWLCRFPLYKDEDIRGKSVQDTSIHCEHILPIMVGLVFTGIAGSKRSDPARSEIRKNLEKMNYAWAHGPCNLLKSNMLLLKYGKSGIEFDEDMGTKLAEKITNHVFQTDRGGIHSVLNTAYAEYATPTEVTEQGKQIKPRKTQNSNKDSGINPIKQKTSDYKDQLIEHYRSVIQYRADIINQEIQQFNRGFGTDHAFNEYLANVMSNVMSELDKVVSIGNNDYEVMHTMVENAKTSYQQAEIEKLEKEIRDLEAQLQKKTKRRIAELSEEEIQTIRERIIVLQNQLDSIKEYGRTYDSPPEHTRPIRQLKSHNSSSLKGFDLSDEFDEPPISKKSKSGGRKHKSIKKRRRQKTNRHKSRKH
jgi:hypothetical protein